jgi:type II secretory pathway pseudopilin PulG
MGQYRREFLGVPPGRAVRSEKAFTLVEVLLAAVIVGVAVPAILLLVGSTTMQSKGIQEYTSAMMLANHTREMMSGLPFDDVQAFNGQSFSPPIDANRQPMSGMDKWQQSIAVQLVGDSQGQHLDTVGDTSAIAARVTVTISQRGSASAPWVQVVTISWLKTRY